MDSNIIGIYRITNKEKVMVAVGSILRFLKCSNFQIINKIEPS